MRTWRYTFTRGQGFSFIFVQVTQNETGSQVSNVGPLVHWFNWAVTWQNQQCCCAPSEDSDQPRPRCPGWSGSLLGAHSVCWFCHVAAQFMGYNCWNLWDTFMKHHRCFLDMINRFVNFQYIPGSSRGIASITLMILFFFWEEPALVLAKGVWNAKEWCFLTCLIGGTSFEPPYDKTNKMTVLSEDSDQPGHQSSVSAWRKLGSLATHWAQGEDRSDWADAEADLSLLGAVILLGLSWGGSFSICTSSKFEDKDHPQLTFCMLSYLT